ncbi:hypothetical protein PT313_01710 [Metamycoplasma hyosynoviae]|uniref:hypothetical protein n=1 Tax=Metamycoplasma hyosynoviae TaxID=29559 RepID=UPI0020C8EC0B|nr:hypothetical protein [Metamycoplasma hyosynoviae]MDC8899979.1 hypothetical protein [Metamycoplasma hyosynoviae]MDC8911600.1 hypothetical protein [Metamycoplasma hyosynoviae]MDC8913855.1 hypothetical protein [Metamycoplasma hyosynoviae]MDC8916266.1 hypothetical protein [Metamycoplasma hyosynoviae]MDC8918286.1 hypothetical protein [Metamycoplasma hyosynoviae]
MNEEKLITFVIPIYHPATTNVDAIFKNLKQQKNQNFNIVCLIDDPYSEELVQINKYLEIFDKRMTLIINSTHNILSEVVKQALEYVQTEYTYFLLSYSQLKNEFTKVFNQFILENKNNTPDFIEVPAYCRQLNDHDFYRSKFEDKKIINLEKSLDPFVLVSPYLFNSISKTSIYKRIFCEMNIKFTSFQYTSSIKYISLLLSKTFVYLSNIWIQDSNNLLTLLNPNNIEKEWKEIEKFAKTFENSNLMTSLQFAKKMHLFYFTAGFLGQLAFSKKTREYKTLNNLKSVLKLNITKFIQNQSFDLNTYNNFINKWKIVIPTDKEILDYKNWKNILKKFIW